MLLYVGIFCTVARAMHKWMIGRKTRPCGLILFAVNGSCFSAVGDTQRCVWTLHCAPRLLSRKPQINKRLIWDETGSRAGSPLLK